MVSKADTSDFRPPSGESPRVDVISSAGEDGAHRGWLTGNRQLILSILSPVILLGIWELAARLGGINTKFFPAPTSIFQTGATLIQNGELWSNVSISLVRIAIGFTIGALPAIVLGLAMGLIAPVRAVIQPLVDATFPIPKIAILPLFTMIFGIGEQTKYAIIAVAVIYLVLINTAAGVRNIEKVYLDVGRNFHAGRLLTFMDIALPGALPMILTGLKLGMGVALLVIVSAEFVGAKSGIGYMIWNSWQVFHIEKMYVGLLASAVIGFASSVLLYGLERVLVPWKPR